jgi:DNA-binding response OmpR family regulator
LRNLQKIMKKIKIFYVEDEPFLAKIVKESLEMRDFDVVLIPDGQQAIDTFSTILPDICLLDVMLPSVDGFQLGKYIRSQNATIPIIYITAKTQTQDILAGFEHGGNDYIKKPFSVEEVIVRINNLLQITKNQLVAIEEHASIKIGNYHFCPLKYELYHEQHVQKISHREAQMITILNEHRNACTDRRAMMMAIWNDDSYFNSRNLDVYIRKLREYFGKDTSVEIITLKGVGYHFMVQG